MCVLLQQQFTLPVYKWHSFLVSISNAMLSQRRRLVYKGPVTRPDRRK